MIERAPAILKTLLENSDEVPPIELVRSREFVDNAPVEGELSDLYNHFLELLDAATELIAREGGRRSFPARNTHLHSGGED
jgi:hypothetical protein